MGADEKVLFFSFPGFSYERDPQQFFDDTCVVPERLEGKIVRNSDKCFDTSC